jgi:hypothetical protein
MRSPPVAIYKAIYGILLLEMFTGKRPTDDMFQDALNLNSLVREALLERVVQIADLILFQGIEKDIYKHE